MLIYVKPQFNILCDSVDGMSPQSIACEKPSDYGIS